MKRIIFISILGVLCTVFVIKEIVQNGNTKNANGVKVIGSEALINLDSRLRFSSFVNNSPGNNMNAEVNPPRFRWFYVQNPKEMKNPIKPNVFRFQVADNNEFKNPIINIETEINFYNELAPLPEGKKYFWRIGYILSGDKEPSSWSDVFTFNIPKGTPKWDRSMLQNPDFNGHPRLLFRKEQLTELRQLAMQDSVFLKQIMVSADNMTRHKWWKNWPETDLDKPDYIYNFYFKLTRELMQTAFAYLITGDQKYEPVLEIWKTIASYPKGGASSPEGMGIGAESEDNTSITEYLACIYDWFYEEMNPAERAFFEESLTWRLSEYMYDFRWGGAIFKGGEKDPYISKSSLALSGYGHSWEGALASLPAAIVLYEKNENARGYFHWIANYIIAVGESVAQNGGYDHGAHYGLSHIKWLVYQLMYLNSALPSLQLGKNPLYEQYSDFFTGQVPVGLKYSHFGRNSQHGAGVEMKKEVFNLLAYLTGNGNTLQNWKNLGEKDKFYWRQWIHVAAPLQFDGELKSIHSDKTNFFFPNTGFVMAHKYPPAELKGFKEGVGVMFCSRPNRGDEYNNENTFQMYAYGQHLNYGGHSGDENPFGFQTIAHNTIMVDGIGQTITKESREQGYRAVLLAYQEDENYTYWVGDATNAYPRQVEATRSTNGWRQKTQIDYDETLFGEKGAPQLERFRRHMLFMRGKYLIIYDDLKTAADRPSVFSWRYRVLPECNPQYSKKEGLLSYTLDDVNVLVKHIAFPELIDFADMQGLDQYKNLITGNNYLTNNTWVAKDMKREDYRNKVCAHNFWFTTEKPLKNHHFLTVIYPVKPNTEAPVIERLDDYTVKIEKDGDVDIVSFDKGTKHAATLIIDKEAFQLPVRFD
ncbi:heparinase II/III family protein [Reichenbachiella sp. MALMAid0571]|uniref:heparinase II/III domain-containing protein n=1 Tax=Reichenbachiella sp. MALMAid0571 TaxID=3143939 RepID=UPI0032DE5C80